MRRFSTVLEDMLMKIMKQEELVAKYEGADAIYALQRKKK